MRIPMRMSSGWLSMRRERPQRALAANPGPGGPSSVGDVDQARWLRRRLKNPDQIWRASGSFVNNGQSSTSSTARNGRKNIARVLHGTRNTATRRPIFDWAKGFEQIAGIGVCGKGFEMKIVVIACFLDPERSCDPPPHRRRVGFPCKRLRSRVTLGALMLSQYLSLAGVCGGHQGAQEYVELALPSDRWQTGNPFAVGRITTSSRITLGPFVRDGVSTRLGWQRRSAS